MDNSRTIKNNIIAIFININYIPNNLYLIVNILPAMPVVSLALAL